MRNLKALVAEDTKPPAESRRAAKAAASITRNGEPKRDRPDRAGQRLIAAHFDGDTFKSFKILCAEEGATTQAMVSEAIELLFRKYHKPISAQLTEQAKERA
jgi:hypothetical protein